MTTKSLSEHDIQCILNDLRVCYSLISVGWPQLEKSLAAIIRRSAAAELGIQPVRELLEDVEKSYDKDDWRLKIERIFRSCFILILAKREPDLLLTSVDEFLLEFPDFSECPEAELELMLKFRNAMKCGIVLYEAKSNKGKLMELAGRLSGKVCTTGGGSTADTKRREFIYEHLGGVIKKKLAVPRKRKNQDDATEETELESPLPDVPFTKRKRPRTQQQVRTKKEASESMLDSVLYRPLPLERSISLLTVDDPSELLVCETASFPCSPSQAVSSRGFSVACFEESYFSDKFMQTPMPAGSSSSSSQAAVAPTAAVSGACGGAVRRGPERVHAFHPFGAPAYGAPLYAPAVPKLQRALTIDFSKPIFSDEYSFHLDLGMF
jgi:hypothetical protein